MLRSRTAKQMVPEHMSISYKELYCFSHRSTRRMALKRRNLRLRRLVVLSLAQHVREVESPFVSRAPSNSGIAEAFHTEGALLLHCEERRGE
jgi:hypothetical protein